MAAAARASAAAGGEFLVWAADEDNGHGRAFYRTLSREALENAICACDLRQFAQLADDGQTWRR
jgi:hypothetical protein